MIRSIDELSNLTTKRAIEPKKYFGEMDLTEEQERKRIEYTEKASDIYDAILILLLTMNESGTVDYPRVRGLLESWLLSLNNEFVTPDEYLIDYVMQSAYNFIEATQGHTNDPWYYSSDRALFNAENGANDVFNYDEYRQAIEEGKTHKKWVTERDNRVRETHRELEGKTIGINDLFRVGLAQMRFPKDYEYAEVFPEELIGCRCTIEYLLNDKEEFHCYGDYLRDVLGSAKDNNPEELQEIISRVESMGGEFHLLSNSENMVTNIQKGKPAIIEVDENASIGAIRHEYRHFLDDMANGNPGLAYYLKDKDKFFEYEKRGYEEELAIARKYGYNEIEKKILKEIEQRKKEIYGATYIS